MKPNYIAIAKTCDSCGGEYSVNCFETFPSGQDIIDLENQIGGLSCITVRVFEFDDSIEKYEEIEE